jgi:SAM-dependent methyltransferase
MTGAWAGWVAAVSGLARTGLRAGVAGLLVLCSWGAAAPARGQARPDAAQSTLTPDQQIFDRYLRWLSGLPLDERTGDMAARYRRYLKSQGTPDAEIERELKVVDQEGRRNEADRWNRYFTEDRPRFNTMPNAFLVQIAESRAPGTALDVGMGQGRNSLWLAREGWDVTGFDPADQAVEVARRNAATLGLPLRTVIASDDTFDFGENRWDLILLSYVGCGLAAPKVERALKPGGVVIVESFHEDAARDHRIGGSICRTGELPPLFKNLRAIHYSEPIAMPDFGNVRMRLVRFAGEKPVKP